MFGFGPVLRCKNMDRFRLHSTASVSSFYLLVFISCFIRESTQGDYPTPYALSPVYLQYLENVETRFYDLLKSSSPADIEDKNEGIVKK